LNRLVFERREPGRGQPTTLCDESYPEPSLVELTNANPKYPAEIRSAHRLGGLVEIGGNGRPRTDQLIDHSARLALRLKRVRNVNNSMSERLGTLENDIVQSPATARRLASDRNPIC
jgi:hypothetical protein